MMDLIHCIGYRRFFKEMIDMEECMDACVCVCVIGFIS